MNLLLETTDYRALARRIAEALAPPDHEQYFGYDHDREVWRRYNILEKLVTARPAPTLAELSSELWKCFENEAALVEDSLRGDEFGKWIWNAIETLYDVGCSYPDPHRDPDTYEYLILLRHETGGDWPFHDWEMPKLH